MINIIELVYIFIYITYICVKYCRGAKVRLNTGLESWSNMYNEIGHKQRWGKKLRMNKSRNKS